MRNFAIGLAVTAYLLPIGTAYALRPTQEHNDHALMWVTLVGLSLVISGTLSAIATKLGREAYSELPIPRPATRKAELALLALPLILAIALPVAFVFSLFAG